MGLTSRASISLVVAFRAGLFVGSVAVGTLGAAGCRRSPPPPPSAAAETLAATYAGCAAVAMNPDGAAVCELGEQRTLRFVVPNSAHDVALAARMAGESPARAEHRPLAPRVVELADGKRFSVDVPDGVSAVIVRASTAGRPAVFTLPVATARALPWLEEAKAQRVRGALDEARTIAEGHADASDAAERAAAKGLLARIALTEGRANDAFPLFRDAIGANRSARRTSDVIDDSFALAFALHQRSHRYDEARQALDAVASELVAYPEGRAREPYYRGILASETGDRRAALRLLRDARERAHELGMARLERNARAAIALEMQALGRTRESIDLLRALEQDPEVRGCERVEVANTLGWSALLANEAAGERVADARDALERAIAAEGCPDVYLKSFALGNLARLALGDGDAAQASRHLESARAAVREPRGTERMSWLDLDAKILLAKHEPRKALARFDEALALARAAILAEPTWSALVGRADALEALGRTADAAAALGAAEDVVDQSMLLVPLAEGRGTFATERSRSARAAIDVLVARGRIDAAARAARRSRTRVLSSVERAVRIESLSADDRSRWEAAIHAYRSAREALDVEARDDWKLPADALARAALERRERERALRSALDAALAVLSPKSARPAPESPVPAGDLDLVVHPGRTGWLVFATDSSKTTMHRVPAPTAGSYPAAAAQLLEPIAPRIEAARRVHVRGYGAFQDVDVHALPFRGAPLGARVDVDYPLGLGAADAEARPRTNDDERAIIVGDPVGDLPNARTEAQLVARTLEPRRATRLFVGRSATSRVVAEALHEAGLFHYAGHGVFGGDEGWESVLPLAEGGRLTIGDLLALTPAPRRVILSGCDAARSSASGASGLGLAQALVVAGSSEVLAPVRPVPDVLAARLADALYTGEAGEILLGARSQGALAHAARLAANRLRELDPASDWAAFRVLTR